MCTQKCYKNVRPEDKSGSWDLCAILELRRRGSGGERGALGPQGQEGNSLRDRKANIW